MVRCFRAGVSAGGSLPDQGRGSTSKALCRPGGAAGSVIALIFQFAVHALDPAVRGAAWPGDHGRQPSHRRRLAPAFSTCPKVDAMDRPYDGPGINGADADGFGWWWNAVRRMCAVLGRWFNGSPRGGQAAAMRRWRTRQGYETVSFDH